MDDRKCSPAKTITRKTVEAKPPAMSEVKRLASVKVRKNLPKRG